MNRGWIVEQSRNRRVRGGRRAGPLILGVLCGDSPEMRDNARIEVVWTLCAWDARKQFGPNI